MKTNKNIQIEKPIFKVNSMLFNEKVALLDNPKTNQEYLNILSTDNDFVIRQKVASHKNTSPETLKKMFKNESKGLIVRKIAINPNTPVEILEELSNSLDNTIRKCVASNVSINEKIMNILVEDKELLVKIELAKNKNTATSVLKILANKKQPTEVLKYVASNSNTPKECLVELSSYWQNEVRASVAANSNTPINTLENMIQDEKNRSILTYFASNPCLNENLINTLLKIEKNTNSYPSISKELAKNEGLNKEILNIMATNTRDYGIMENIAKNPKTSNSTLKYLLNMPSSRIWSNIASNPNASLEILEILSEKKMEGMDFSDMYKNIATNPNVDTYLLDYLLSKKYINKKSNVRVAIATNKNTHPKTLLKLAKDLDEEVRNAALTNENTPPIEDTILDYIKIKIEDLIDWYLRRKEGTISKYPAL